MGIAFLLLGLVPLMFLPHTTEAAQDDEISDTENDDPGVDTDLLGDPLTTMEPSNVDPVDIQLPVDLIDHPDDGTQVVDPSAVLKPVDDVDQTGQNTGVVNEVLLPVDQIESERETIFVDASADAGLAYAEIEGFESGLDTLLVSIDPDQVTGDLDVEVAPTDDGLDAKVFVEQHLVAILKGAPEASRDDIVVEIARSVA